MKDKLLTFIRDHNLVNDNKTVLIGVSGGPDSMALLHFLNEWKKKWNLRVIAITIDHQLREEASREDVQYVRTMCEKWDIPFVSTSVNVKAYKQKHKVSTQVAARVVRYAAFEEQMILHGGDYLALGHHGDDQIETMIMSLSRTTSLSSLTGIPVKRKLMKGEVIRPLLCVTKSEIEQYCSKYKIEPKMDATNLETYYMRNFVRAHIVPRLKERHDNLHMTIQRLSETLAEDEQYLVERAKRVVTAAAQFDERENKVSLSLDSFNSHAISLQRRAYRLILDYLYDELPENLSYVHEDIFISLLREESSNQVVHFPKQLFIERSYNTILFYFHTKQSESNFFSELITEIPTKVTLPDGAALSVTSITEKEASEREDNLYTYVCPKNQFTFPLHIRTRKDGDRMRYEGLQGTKKIKDIFIDAKVPRQKRDHTYILTDHSEEIYWLVGLRKNRISNHLVNDCYLLFELKM